MSPKKEVADYFREKLRLELSETKTLVTPVTVLGFLDGYGSLHIFRNQRVGVDTD
jgi:hypothetical protein